MVNPPLSRLDWRRTFRLINSAYPPIDLFEDIADPADWAVLAQAEGKTNPRLAETIAKLDLIPPERHVGGFGASYVMSPFTHCSADSAGRFHDGNFGAYYAANSFETALAETIFHTVKFLTATDEEPGWIAQKRELIGSIDAELIDLRGGDYLALLDPVDYTASQSFANEARKANVDGVVYPSLRQPGGECFAAFWPNVMSIPLQGRHISYHWNGNRVDYIRDLAIDGDGPVYALDE
nr:RES family NAD+ phosphorylase [Sphingorhabdus sp. EL138]